MAIKYGAAYPMGARMMSGQKYHEQLENATEWKKDIY
jgi:hypothetical protein